MALTCAAVYASRCAPARWGRGQECTLSHRPGAPGDAVPRRARPGRQRGSWQAHQAPGAPQAVGSARSTGGPQGAGSPADPGSLPASRWRGFTGRDSQDGEGPAVEAAAWGCRQRAHEDEPGPANSGQEGRRCQGPRPSQSRRPTSGSLPSARPEVGVAAQCSLPEGPFRGRPGRGGRPGGRTRSGPGGPSSRKVFSRVSRNRPSPWAGIPSRTVA